MKDEIVDSIRIFIHNHCLVSIWFVVLSFNLKKKKSIWFVVFLY